MTIDWASLDHEVPLLLVPVRLETQTEPVPPDAPEDTPVRLRVRIYPDDVGLDRESGRPLLLPDAFVVLAEVDGHWLPAVEANPVDVVHLGLGRPDGTADERLDELAGSLKALTRHEDTDAAWLWSYEAAEAVGMAVTLELPPGTERVETLVVLGARAGRSPDDESAAVTAALRVHGPDAGFLRPGDPTNNTETARSAWSRPTDEVDPGRAPVALAPDAAAAVLAAALGHPGAPLDDWVGADDPGEAWAEAMATALWPVTWGAFLARSVRGGTLHPDRVERVRRHHGSTVRGRGPLPLLRLGRQPYGVLPVTDLATVEGVSGDVDALARLLERTDLLWQAGSRSVPSVPGGGIRALPEILGQTPVSWGLRLRRLLHTGGPLASVLSAGSYEQAQARADLTGLFESILGWSAGTLADPDLLGVDRTLGVPLVADDDPQVLAGLADGGDAGEASVLQILLALALSQTRADVDSRRDGPPIEDDDEHRDRRTRVLLSSLRDGRLRQLLREDVAGYAADVLEALLGGDPRPEAASKALRHVDDAMEGRDGFPHWPWPLVALDPAFRPDTVEGQLDELRGLLRAMVVWGDVTGAVRRLAEVGDPGERRGLLAETLDCASHRRDAWVTSVATARLHQLRSSRPTGLAVGAFGFVEDLRLVRRQRPAEPDAPVAQPAGRGGVVHAPSLRHAATAAVLRGGRLAHAPGDESDRALEMDLSSTRVREAREVLAGMRAGQELGALLGYRFERWLADAHPVLNRFVAPLRALAPTVAAKEVDRVAEGLVDLGVEVVAASQVVDGVRLLEVFTDDAGAVDTAALADALEDPPAALKRYPAAWTGPTADEQGPLAAAVARLSSLLDAVGDLLLAEGVHQVVAGNTARAAAAMDALSGDGLPPEPEVSAPPQDRAGLSHRLVVLLPHSPASSAADGWAETPRARANPRLEAWCRVVLGPASRVVVGPRGRTLRTLRISALDLVEAAGDGTLGLDAFWARARRAHSGLLAHPLTDRPGGLAPTRSTLPETWRLAATLRSVLTASRPLEPGDVVHDTREDPVRPAPTAPEAADPWRAALQSLLDQLSTLATTTPPADPRRLVDQLGEFGIGDASPVEKDTALLAAQVAAAQQEAQARVDAVRPLLGPTATADDVAAAARRLTGSELPVPLPLDAPGPPEPLTAAWDVDDGRQQHGIRPWLARHARVRPAVHGYTEVSMLRAAARRRVPLRAVTLGTAGWLGERLPDAVAPVSAHTSLVVEAVPGVHPGEGYSGLVLDGWHETLPRRRAVRDDTTAAPAPDAAGPEPQEVATTGLAVHANGPDARAPQALLLGVTPNGMPWTQESVLGLVDGTRALARQRLVTLERLPLAGSLLPAATVAHWSLQGERVLDPRFLSQLADASVTPRFVRFDG